MKKCFYCLFFITLFLLPYDKAFAISGSTTLQYATGVSSCTKTNTSNTIGAPTGTYTSSDTNSCTLTGFSTGSQIPSNAHIDSINLNVYSTGSTMGVFFGNSGTDECAINLNNPNNLWFPSGLNPSVPSSATIYGGGSGSSTWCTALVPSNFQTGSGTQWRFNSYSGSNFALGGVSQVVNWTYIPQLSISSVVASPSANTISMTASGDTTITSSSEQCKIQLTEEDITNPSSPVFLASNFATILLDSSQPRTSTLNEGNNTYLGQGFSPSSSSWSAVGVIAPFYSGKDITISASTYCTHNVSNSNGSISQIIDTDYQGFNSLLNTNFSPFLNSTPSALNNTPIVTQGQCTSSDWICSFEQWISQTFINTFGINGTFASDQFGYLHDAFNAKAPFAYVNSALGLNFSATGVSTSTPSLNLSFAIPGNSYVASMPAISWSDSGSSNIVSNFASTFSNIILIVEWFAFIWYIVTRIRNIL